MRGSPGPRTGQGQGLGEQGNAGGTRLVSDLGEPGFLGTSGLPARLGEHSWMKQARLVFPVPSLFKGKEEVKLPGQREKEQLSAKPSQSPVRMGTGLQTP